MNISARFYGLLLFAYPAEFRRQFGLQMLQVFRDCYRAEASDGSLPRFWLRTLVDLVFTAAKERSDNSGREGVLMNRRSDGMIMLVAFGIIVIALLLHRYIVTNNVAIFLVGYVLDALISTGVIGNLLVFVLNKTTKLNPLRTAIVVFAVVHAALLLLIVVISRNVPGMDNWGAVLISYVLSFAIWVGLHFAWRSKTGGRSSVQEQDIR